MGKCTKCGTNFVGTAANPPPDGLCRYCERDALKAENAKLRKALAELVGADGAKELDEMELGLRVMPGIEADKIAAVNAIHALRDTLRPNCDYTTGK